MRAIVTVIGADRPGIIANVSARLFKANANILDINQTVLQGEFFAMTMLVDLKDLSCDFKQLKASLEEGGEELGVEIRLQREEILNSMHRV